MLGKLIVTKMWTHAWSAPDVARDGSSPAAFVDVGTPALVIGVSGYNKAEGNCLCLLLPDGSMGWIDESYCREVER